MSTTIVGNLTRDPEVRFSPQGVAVANFSVAENRRHKNKDTGEWEDNPEYFEVVAFRELAENIAETLSKGNRVIVTGEFTARKWKTKDGEDRKSFELVADEVAVSLRWATAEVTRKTGKRDDR